MVGTSNLPYVYKDNMIAASVVLPAVGIILSGLRFYARKRNKQGLGTDDWMIIPALATETALGIILLIGVAHQVIGYPTPLPPPGASPEVQLHWPLLGPNLPQKLEFAFFLCSIACFGFVKLSVLFFYRRVFAVGKSTFNTVCWIGIGFSIIWTVAFFIGQITWCSPKVSDYWAGLPLGADCGNGLDFLLAMAATDVASDAVIFFLPFPVIWRLHASVQKRLMTTAVFLLGSVSLVAAILRLYVHAGQTDAGYDYKVDIFLNWGQVYYWTMLEAGIALIAINLPTLHHFFGARSIQSVVGSMRSKMSINSLRTGSGSTRNDSHGGTGARPHSASTHAETHSVPTREKGSDDIV